MVETQTERKVKKLRTDNGLEFGNYKLDEFHKDDGVVKHRTCTYTPHQNGVAERLNKTIMDKVRSMLSESGLDKKFWIEAASTSVYLINMSLSSATDLNIPEERWTSPVPDLTGLRRFGCIAYVHFDEGKLNPKEKKGVFTRYLDGVKGFRVWLLDDKKCVISRNVVLREDVIYKDIKADTTPGNSQLISVTNKTVSFYFAGNDKDSTNLVEDGATQNKFKLKKSLRQKQKQLVRVCVT